MKQEYKKIITPIIKKAGEKAKKSWQNFNRHNSTLKSQTQIVTKVDKDTETFLIKSIKKYFPLHSFLGEESGKSKNQSDYTWIIDPIDGTTNFTIHNPLWSISIALAYKDEVIFGAIYIPILDELYLADKDKGAYLNNKKIKKLKKLNKQKVIHTFCHGDKKRDLKIALNYYRQQKMDSLDCRQLGSAAIELCYVAIGRIDSLLIPGAKSWDIAAGALIAKEAGAEVVNFTGETWILKNNDIIACHPEITNTILKRVNKAKK